jgi:hypothetical protein
MNWPKVRGLQPTNYVGRLNSRLEVVQDLVVSHTSRPSAEEGSRMDIGWTHHCRGAVDRFTKVSCLSHMSGIFNMDLPCMQICTSTGTCRALVLHPRSPLPVHYQRASEAADGTTCWHDERVQKVGS